VKKLTVFALSLFILILFAHGTLPAQKNVTVDVKSKVILSMEQGHEEFPSPDLDDKKTLFSLNGPILLISTILYTLINRRVIRNERQFSFLKAVFFQSSYLR